MKQPNVGLDVLLSGMKEHNAELVGRQYDELIALHPSTAEEFQNIAQFMSFATKTWMAWPESDRALALRFLQETHEHVKKYGIENS